MKLHDIFDLVSLEEEIAAGYINRRFHPEFPTLATVGYSDTTQFANRWNATTMACRGIIYDTVTLDVLARPFAKFFNFGQGDAVFDLDAPLVGAFTKFDGSLGIRYTRPDGLTAIATRGSFDSEQARHATKLAWAAGWTAGEPGVTELYEIIYADNRIVLDYGDMDALVSLGSISIDTGAYTPADSQESLAVTLRDVLALPPEANTEGFVAWVGPFTAVKIKHAEYIALHRIISSLSKKEVWRQLRAGTFTEFATSLPDEFHQWATDMRDVLVANFNTLHETAVSAHSRVIAEAAEDRKSQAVWISKNLDRGLRGYAFSLLDGRDISDNVWRDIEPSGAAEPALDFAEAA